MWPFLYSDNFLYACSFESFILNGCWICSNAVSALIEMIRAIVLWAAFCVSTPPGAPRSPGLLRPSLGVERHQRCCCWGGAVIPGSWMSTHFLEFLVAGAAVAPGAAGCCHWGGWVLGTTAGGDWGLSHKSFCDPGSSCLSYRQCSFGSSPPTRPSDLQMYRSPRHPRVLCRGSFAGLWMSHWL